MGPIGTHVIAFMYLQTKDQVPPGVHVFAQAKNAEARAKLIDAATKHAGSHMMVLLHCILLIIM